METPKTAEVAHIGRSVIVKGELSGSEDLYIDGQVEGTIELKGNSLTIGPNGQLRANVNAKNVFVHGRLEGNVWATERVELRKSAVAIGDIFAQRIAIEDGAYFKGKVDIQKDAPKATSQPTAKSDSASSTSNSPAAATSTDTVQTGVAASAGGGSVSGTGKTAVIEQKKF
jgi:cytoskeletal protein CcmA (bactofilin family)